MLILVAGFFGGGIIAGIFTSIVKETPEVTLDDLRPEGFATIIYDSSNKEIARLRGSEANRREIDIDDLPAYVGQAFIAIEDERFYEHSGIDLKSIARAFVVNIKNFGFDQGGSTLTQQVIKNNILTSNKALSRKIQEQYLSISLENRLTKTYGKKQAKDKILEHYLNTINMGSTAFGIQAAAEVYFGKDAKDLTVAEAATLSGITPNPVYLNPRDYPEDNKARKDIIIGKMLEQGYITQADHDAALKEDVYGTIQSVTPPESSSYNSYFVDAVYEQLMEDLVADDKMTKQEASTLIYRGGLKVYTTQDSFAQKVLEETMLDNSLFPEGDFAIQLEYRLSVTHSNGKTEHFSNPRYTKDGSPWGSSLFKSKEEAEAYVTTYRKATLKQTDTILGEAKILTPQPQASMVISDYRTGEVKALVGGRGEKTGNRTFNRATDKRALRQPGSTFKMLTAFGPAIDMGLATPSTVIDDLPLSIPLDKKNSYEPNNWYHGPRFKYWYEGLSSIRKGAYRSMNILAIKTLQMVGLENAYDYLIKFGFTSLNREQDQVYSMGLGGQANGVTALELNAAYGSIANGGLYKQPILYYKVIDKNNNVLLENKSEEHRVLKETSAYLITNMMESVVTHPRGTGGRTAFKNYKMPVAGKTGTTQKSKDLWFAGYTPYYAGTIWTGYDLGQTMGNGSFHAIIWRTVMEKIHATKQLPYKEFNVPSNIVTKEICMDSGHLPTDLCKKDPRGSRVITEYFVKGTEPTKECEVHYEVEICKDSSLLASPSCPTESREMKVFIKRPEGKELDLTQFDATTLNRIADYRYEMPPALIGEYHQEPHPEQSPTIPVVGDPDTTVEPTDSVDPGTLEIPVP